MAALDLAVPSAADHGSYADWYSDHWGPTHGLAMRLLDDPVTAEDVAAEVLCRVWNRWQTSGVPRWPTAYLAQATRNAVADVTRRRAHERRLLEQLATDRHERDPGEGVADRAAVVDVLDRLPAAERETLRLIYLEGLSPDEAAAQLGIRPGSVRSRLCRSRRRFAVEE